jgi:L-aminopeptidase/D-esterase-like protein
LASVGPAPIRRDPGCATGISIGAPPPGPLDAITDVPGVRVGQVTIARGAAIADDTLNPLFQAVADATEEAILNSLFRAQSVRGMRGAAEALPLDRVRRLLQDHRVLPP